MARFHRILPWAGRTYTFPSRWQQYKLKAMARARRRSRIARSRIARRSRGARRPFIAQRPAASAQLAGTYDVWLDAVSNYAKPAAPYVEVLYPFSAPLLASPTLGQPNEELEILEIVGPAAEPAWIQNFHCGPGGPDVQFWKVIDQDGDVGQIFAGRAETHIPYATLEGLTLPAVLRREGPGNDVFGTVSGIRCLADGSSVGEFSPSAAPPGMSLTS